MFACSASDWYQFCSSCFAFALADVFRLPTADTGRRPALRACQSVWYAI